VQLRSGTDAALISAMMSIILAEGLENKEFIASKTTGFGELRDFLSKVELKEAERITSVPLEKIREAAITYAKAQRACILYDQGICQHTVGGDNIKVHADLALLCGHAGKPGSGVNSMRGQINGEGSGDMGCLCVFYPGFRRVGEESARFFADAWGWVTCPPSLALLAVTYPYPPPDAYNPCQRIDASFLSLSTFSEAKLHIIVQYQCAETLNSRAESC